MFPDCVFIRKDSYEHIFDRELEIIEEQIQICLIHCLFLSSMDSD